MTGLRVVDVNDGVSHESPMSPDDVVMADWDADDLDSSSGRALECCRADLGGGYRYGEKDYFHGSPSCRLLTRACGRS